MGQNSRVPVEVFMDELEEFLVVRVEEGLEEVEEGGVD